MSKSILYNETEAYSSIHKALISDNTLPYQARFIYIYMAAKPHGWEFYHEPIAKGLGISPDTFKKYLKMLVDAGWIDRGEQSNENGRFGAVEYHIRASKRRPSRKNTDTENFRNGKNPQQYNKSIINNTHNNNSTINSPIIDDNNSHSCISACARENSLLEVEKSELLSDETWQEAVCMKLHMTREELRTQIEEFFVYCQCSGTEAHNSVSDAKGHFFNRLTQQLNSNKKTFKFRAYDVQPEDSEKEAKFKTWMRTNHAELENVEKPLSYEEWCALRTEYIEDFEGTADCEAFMRQVLDQIDANIGYYRMSNIYATMRRKFEERRA